MKKYFGKYSDDAAMKNAVASGELTSPFVAYTEDNDSVHFNDYFYADVTIDTTSVSPAGGSATVSINAGEDVGSWSADCSDEFVTFAPASGTSGESQVVFTFEANEGNDRMAMLVIRFYDSFGQFVSYRQFNVTQGQLTENQRPLTLEFLSSGNVNFTGFSGNNITDVECNINGGGWEYVTEYPNGVDVVSGDTIQLRGGSENTRGYSTLIASKTPYIVSTADFNARGNIFSMISPEYYTEVTSPNVRICQMFGYCSTLKSAENLYMGNADTTLIAAQQYQQFFRDSSLEKAPALPMTTLSNSCYNSMFANCTSLTTAPQLPSESLAASCYTSMFNGCIALTDAPELPAGTLLKSCYQSMFSGCTSLDAITCLATDRTAANCTVSWVDGVAATGIFTKNADYAEWTTGVNGVPEGWTVVDAS